MPHQIAASIKQTPKLRCPLLHLLLKLTRSTFENVGSTTTNWAPAVPHQPPSSDLPAKGFVRAQAVEGSYTCLVNTRVVVPSGRTMMS